MLELNGKFNSCKVFTDLIEEKAISQLITLLNQPFIKDSKIRIMPDVHAGAGCVIGTTMTLHDKVVSDLVGCDIGCFAAETKVWCSAGYYKSIKELAEDGTPFQTDCFDTEDNYFCEDRAIAFQTRKNAKLVAVTYIQHGLVKSREIRVRCTPDHRFRVCLEDTGPMPNYKGRNTIWLEAECLEPGMQLVANDSYITVKSVEPLPEREDVYCLSVRDMHNFTIEGGVIVHNCGMLTVKLKEKESEMDLAQLDQVIREFVPSGFNVHDKQRHATPLDCTKLACWNKKNAGINEMLAYRSVGTLGGGNHFLEVDKDSEDNLYLVIHTGSRHLGLEVAKYYQDLAWSRFTNLRNDYRFQEKQQALIDRLKEEGRYSEIESEIQRLRAEYKADIPVTTKDLAYVEGYDFDHYIHDMKMVQEHACANRAAIAATIIKQMNFIEEDRFETIHNYIDTDHMILRKGSVSARKGERLLIPMNMRDGSLICIGKGNDDWNQSAPHGAGRLMSRSKAKEQIALSDFEESMRGIYTTSVNRSTIDESPFAYKPMESILENIGDTVEIVDVIKPVYNFKASDA